MNNTDTKLVRGNLVDIISREIYGAVVTISNGKISKIDKVLNEWESKGILEAMNLYYPKGNRVSLANLFLDNDIVNKLFEDINQDSSDNNQSNIIFTL